MPADDANSDDDERIDNEKKQVGKKPFTKNLKNQWKDFQMLCIHFVPPH